MTWRSERSRSCATCAGSPTTKMQSPGAVSTPRRCGGQLAVSVGGKEATSRPSRWEPGGRGLRSAVAEPTRVTAADTRETTDKERRGPVHVVALRTRVPAACSSRVTEFRSRRRNRAPHRKKPKARDALLRPAGWTDHRRRRHRGSPPLSSSLRVRQRHWVHRRAWGIGPDRG